MTNDSITRKRCLSGEQCLHPDGPELPLTEFHKHPHSKDGRQPRCKRCVSQQHKDRKPEHAIRRGDIANGFERMVIEQLRDMGIYAAPGKSSEFYSLDVVAWGCVRIECKGSVKDREGRYQFNFSNQKRRGIQGDIVVLVCVDGNDITFHVFPSKHSIFFKHGHVKCKLQYDPYQTRYKGNGERLTPALMNQYRDMWCLIEDKRLEISTSLKGGLYLPTRVVGVGVRLLL